MRKLTETIKVGAILTSNTPQNVHENLVELIRAGEIASLPEELTERQAREVLDLIGVA
jgi:hypothetical protein